MLQAAMTPFVGAAGKTCNRIFLAMIGTLIWGITNIGIGVASTFRQVCLMLSNATLGCGQFYVMLQVLQIKLGLFGPIHRKGFIWHDDSMLRTIRQPRISMFL